MKGKRSQDTGTPIEIRHLRYAKAANDYGSFRKAALMLNIKQSTLSRTISQMEDRLGIILFERTPGGVRPTKAGSEVIRTCRYLVEAINLMETSAASLSLGETGHFTVGFYTSLSAGNLRATLTEFAGKFPKIIFRTVEASRTRLFSDLESGVLDVAVVTGDPEPGEKNAMYLWTERVMAVLPEIHPMVEKKQVHWSDLRDETFLLRRADPGAEFRDILVSKLAQFGAQPRLVVHDASQESIGSLVGAGFGISLVTEASIGTRIPGVAYRELRDGNGPSRISYATHWRRDNENPALANFIALLEERYPSPAAFD